MAFADVADQVGASIGTVSEAPDGRGQLPVQARDQVLAVAGQLGLGSEPAGQGLAAQGADAMGAIFNQP